MRMDLLRSGSFLAESSLCVTSSKSRNPKGWGQWSKDSWENIGEFARFVTESFCPERPMIFEEPEMFVVKHQSTPWMNFLEGTKKVEVVRDSHLYQLPSIICLIRQHLSSLQNWW